MYNNLDEEGFSEKNLIYSDSNDNNAFTRNDANSSAINDNEYSKNQNFNKSYEEISNKKLNNGKEDEENKYDKFNNVRESYIANNREKSYLSHQDNTNFENKNESDNNDEFDPNNYDDNAFSNSASKSINIDLAESLNNENKKQNLVNDLDNEEYIDEEIAIDNDDSYDRSKKVNIFNIKNVSGVSYGVSQSGGFDGTVDAKALNKFSYIEKADNNP